SQGNQIRIEPVPPTRGLILDRRGRVLAENRASFSLELTPEQVPDVADALGRLADLELLDREDLPDIRQKIAARRRFDTIPIREQLTEAEVARFAVNR
ncbi:MAG: penicillin-binding protein 2, partial [Gammaproteobacteria bacterium]|nr:penicillin-binding protein 2 [Gammaproteobacteria bacterium]